MQEDRRPGVHRGANIAEVPLVSRDLAAGVQIDLTEHQIELFLGEIYIHCRQSNRLERQVPRSIPRILPFIRHRDDVVVDHMEPFTIPNPSVARER